MDYSISREDPEKARSDILSAWRESLPSLHEKRIEWIYSGNPAGGARVWIARADGRVIGSTALLLRTFAIDGSTWVAGISADFSVVAGHRGFGPALALQRQAVEAVERGEAAFIYGLPNPGAVPLLRRAGHRTIGSVVTLTRLLRTRELLSRRTKSRALAALLAPLGDLAIRVHTADSAFFRRSRRRFSGRELTEFDERFDELWKSVQPDHAILGDRSAHFLRWRFGQSPQRDHRTFGLLDRQTDELAGYVVYHMVEGRAVIDDLLCRNLTGVLDGLLTDFARFQRRQGAAAITVGFFGDPKLVEGLRRNHFRVRDAAGPVVLYVSPGSPIAQILESPENWWFLPADNDL